MKIERISDNQIKVFLSQTDLLDRKIKISELAYGSEKAQDLFRDMMERAFEEHGFDADNSPLMIEAVPLSTESIMIIVTKVESPEELDEKLGTFHPYKSPRRFKKKAPEGDGLSDVSRSANHPTWIYSFTTLDAVTDLAKQIYGLYEGTNTLYKDHTTDKYFLVLYANRNPNAHHTTVEGILSEYGQKHISTSLSEGFLMEHGQKLIQGKAIQILTKYLS
ncbi:MAG: adaptor protein MecA [Epulopiscium sp.]|nr:adaptor protein MecA [Candidatus Epulonipiscium sp.]